jgi:hypothetical protein
LAKGKIYEQGETTDVSARQHSSRVDANELLRVFHSELVSPRRICEGRWR